MAPAIGKRPKHRVLPSWNTDSATALDAFAYSFLIWCVYFTRGNLTRALRTLCEDGLFCQAVSAISFRDSIALVFLSVPPHRELRSTFPCTLRKQTCSRRSCKFYQQQCPIIQCAKEKARLIAKANTQFIVHVLILVNTCNLD